MVDENAGLAMTHMGSHVDDALPSPLPRPAPRLSKPWKLARHRHHAHLCLLSTHYHNMVIKPPPPPPLQCNTLVCEDLTPM